MNDPTSNKLDFGGLFLNEALDALMQSDFALAHAPTLDLKEPHLLSDVTQAWLQQTLGDKIPGAILDNLIVEDEHSGMTDRKKWSLEWNRTGQEAGLPKTIFVKATPEIPYHRETLSVLHMHTLESNFYKQIQPEIPDLAPPAYYAESYPGGRFLILLEDLESSDCKPYWVKDNASIEHIKAVAVALAKLHAKYWESDRLQGDLSWVRPRTCRFGWPWLRDKMPPLREKFIEMADADILPEDVKQVLDLWGEHAVKTFEYLETLPHTVLHGDSHIGNTFSYPDGRAGLFDWQVMFSGHGLRDYAYFFFSAINNDDRKKYEKEVFELYIDTLAEHGVTLDKNSAWDLYCIFILDRWDAGITSYVYGNYNHDPVGQKRGLFATAEAIKDHDIGTKLQQLIDTKL